jgi:glutamate racemase
MIGVFDSGHGGLTVLDALVRKLPGQSFLYLGDHANAPYGEKEGREILELTKDGVDQLFRSGCRLAILACNTAAAVALRSLQHDWLPQSWPGNRVLGVVVPTVEAVTGTRWNGWTTRPPAETSGTVSVFATPATVRSRCYEIEVAKRAPRIEVVSQSCPELAGLIEAGAPRALLAECVAEHVSSCMASLGGRKPDSALLGCTHYPLVKDLFRESLPEGTRLLCQPSHVASSTSSYLKRHPEFASASRENGPMLLTSGDEERVSRFSQAFRSQLVGLEGLRFQSAGRLAQDVSTESRSLSRA